MLTQIAVEQARTNLSARGIELHRSDEAILHRYLQISGATIAKAGQISAVISGNYLGLSQGSGLRRPSLRPRLRLESLVNESTDIPIVRGGTRATAKPSRKRALAIARIWRSQANSALVTC